MQWFILGFVSERYRITINGLHVITYDEKYIDNDTRMTHWQWYNEC